ncbi:MAG: hypothetical protein FK734_05975 [Asgard group archaeon]|nr:hypothetical protein [Asgard group archaeon]
MTTWAWTCRNCGYEFINPIFRFIEQCPKCQAEYIRLANANGIRSFGLLPIYSLVGETIDNQKTLNSVKFAIAVKAKSIECFDKNFHQYLQENFLDELKKKGIELLFTEK